MTVKIGVRRERNASGEGRRFDLGDVSRLSCAALRPTILNTAPIPAPRQILPKEVPVARCKAAVVISRGAGCDVSSLRSVSTQLMHVKRCSPVEVPLADHASDSHPSDSSYDSPCPNPDQGDKEDEPPGVWAYDKDPGVFSRMSPITDCP